MKNVLLFMAFALIFGLWSCKKIGTDNPITDPSLKTMKDLAIPNSFSFQTSGEVSVGILVKNSSSILAGVPVSIYLDFPGYAESPKLNARLVGTFLSNSSGRIDVKLKFSKSQDSLYLKTNYIGLESEAGFKIIGTSATYTYSEGNTIKSAPLKPSSGLQNKAGVVFSYMGTYDSQGVPTYLEKVPDNIPQSLLNDINASLPVNKHLPVSNPQYFSNTNESGIILKEQADIWITFVSEGASTMNSVGYYTYDAINPPQTRSDITKFNVIFPNTSLSGSGGGLHSGDKVYLGKFDAGKAIGLFLVGYGWKNNSVSTSSPIYFSDIILNPETDPTKRQHTVLLYDNLRGITLWGFEDQNRFSTIQSDEDFNDVIFYITTNPVKAVDVTKVPSIDTPLDDDKDGISNNFDEFPLDSKRAFTNYYPAKDQYNSLLVEDLWPSFGDFDFNDLVVDCQYKQVLNAQSSIVDLYVKLKVRAIGASFKNGFGIQLPVAPSAVSAVTLTNQAGTINTISLESGQDKAVVIAFEDAFTLLPSTGGSGVNVVSGAGWSEPKEIELHFTFATPLLATSIGTAPYNPFITVNGDRTKEIHLSGAAPTSKANVQFFGQGDDTTNPATSRYYKSANNLVWMLEVPSSFQYTTERNDITKAYLKLGAWAESGGSLYKDWYLDLSGYRDNSLIYSK
jgi:LruC domain-containing protein